MGEYTKLKEEFGALINKAADLKIQNTNGSLDDEAYRREIDNIFILMKDINHKIRPVGEDVNGKRENVNANGGKRKLRKTKRMLKKYKPRKHKTRRSNH